LKAISVVLGCLMSVVKLMRYLLNIHAAYSVGDPLTVALEALKVGMCCLLLWRQRTMLKQSGVELTKVLSKSLRKLSSGLLRRQSIKRKDNDKDNEM
jgi:hypothetical protein